MGKKFHTNPPVETKIRIAPVVGDDTATLSDDFVSVFTWNFKNYLKEMLVDPGLFGDVNKLVLNKEGNRWS